MASWVILLFQLIFHLSVSTLVSAVFFFKKALWHQHVCSHSICIGCDFAIRFFFHHSGSEIVSAGLFQICVGCTFVVCNSVRIVDGELALLLWVYQLDMLAKIQ